MTVCITLVTIKATFLYYMIEAKSYLINETKHPKPSESLAKILVLSFVSKPNKYKNHFQSVKPCYEDFALILKQRYDNNTNNNNKRIVRAGSCFPTQANNVIVLTKTTYKI